MTSKKSTPDLKPKPLDALVVLAVIALGVAVSLWVYGGKTDSTALTATGKHRGEVIEQVSLSALTESKTIDLDGTYHLTVLLERDGVTVTESDCPGQDCVHTGKITQSGQSIVCLPEQVVVTLTGADSDGADIVLG